MIAEVTQMKRIIIAAVIALTTTAAHAEIDQQAAISVCGNVLSSVANVPAVHSGGYVKRTAEGGAEVTVTIDFMRTGRELRGRYTCRFNALGRITAILDEDDHYLYP